MEGRSREPGSGGEEGKWIGKGGHATASSGKGVSVRASDGQFLMGASEKEKGPGSGKRRSRPNERALARLRPPEEIFRDPE